MLKKLQKRDSRGFTIIEVMIVLAIAALILLIVLLAVPALQRNSRNTAIKNDASAVVAGVSEFSSNNDGKIPLAASSSWASGTLTLDNSGGTAATVKVQASDTFNIRPDGTVTAVTPAAGELTITFKTKCPTTVSGTTATPTANTRSTTVIYAVETSNALAAKCIDS